MLLPSADDHAGIFAYAMEFNAYAAFESAIFQGCGGYGSGVADVDQQVATLFGRLAQ